MSSLIHNLARFLEMNRDQYLWHAISVVFYWYIAIAIHDIFFHPLARCPGPWISKFSQLPNFYHAIKGDRHIWIWQNHQIYGDKVRIQPNEVVFLAPQASRDIYGSKANVRRSKSYEAWKTVKEANTILTIDPAAHARKRRILNQAFTEKSVKHATEFVSVHTERWIDLISQEKDITTDDGWTRTRNMSDWNDWLVFDILGDICFGRSFDIKEPGPNPIRVMPRLVIKHVQMFYPILQSPFMKFFVWAKPKGLDYLLKLVTPQEVKNYYKLDMFHFLCNARDPVTNEPYTESALRGEAAMLIVAGSDSTSSVLAGFWFYISRNERAYRRLTDEIRTTFTASEEIKSGPKLASCVYLYACIDESLRMVPAGPSELAREVLAGGATINGEHFPPGVVVGCAPWAMGRNELIFGDSTKFRPERYIPSETTGISVEDVSRIKSYYNPFLIGPGNCAGKNIAMAEIAIVIAKTLFRVDLRAVPGEDLGAGHPSMGWGRRDENQYQVEDAYITVHEGPMLQFKKRMV